MNTKLSVGDRVRVAMRFKKVTKKNQDLAKLIDRQEGVIAGFELSTKAVVIFGQNTRRGMWGAFRYSVPVDWLVPVDPIDQMIQAVL